MNNSSRGLFYSEYKRGFGIEKYLVKLNSYDRAMIAPHFSLLSPTSPCELSEREVTSPFNLKVVGALDNYSLVFVIFNS
jgi:hypothetical protein